MTTNLDQSLQEPYVSAEEVEAELRRLKPAASVDTTSIATSYAKLDDRQFEMLLSCLFRTGDSPIDKLDYDDVRLLRPGVDGGRDVVLLREQCPAAAVQCKNHIAPLALPNVIREIARFLLAAKLDPRVLPDPTSFTYVLAVSGGISKTGQELFHETSRIVREKEQLIRTCTAEVVKKYKSLKKLDLAAAADYVVETLGKLTLKLLTSEDLDMWVHRKPDVYATFFAARMVVEVTALNAGLAVLREDFRRNSDDAAHRQAALNRWRHPSSAAAFSVVARARSASGARPIVLGDVYVRRTIEAEVDKWLSRATQGSEGTLVGIVAPGGYGKTSLLWNCHRIHATESNCEPFLFSASLIVSMAAQGHFDESLAALVDHVRTQSANGVRVLVCLDTFDVLSHEEHLLNIGLRLISELMRAGASVLVTSRPEEIARIPLEELATLTARLYLQEYDEREFSEAVDSHCRAFYRTSGRSTAQIDEQVERLQNLVALGRPVKDVCLNPLTLRMLFELYAPDEVPEDINSFRLYSEYWIARVLADRRAASQVSATGRDLSVPVQFLAAQMLATGAPLIAREQVAEYIASARLREGDVAELISRNLLVRTEAGSLEFFHQTFFEHAAARYLANVDGMDLPACVERLRELADDGFRLPVYEQLFLLHAAGSPSGSPIVERAVGNLLLQSHPAMLGVGLHAHVLSANGYAKGREFTAGAAARKDAYVLKRLSQLIYNLRPQRVGEIRAVIDAAWNDADWTVLELLARMFIWLAQADWEACREEMGIHDLVEELQKRSPNRTVDAERWIVSVLQHGVQFDDVWVITQALRCVRNRRHARLALEFIAREAKRISQDAARLAATEIVSRVAGAPQHHDESDLDPSAACLAALWDAYPILAPTAASVIAASDAAESTLTLRALALATAAPVDIVKERLLARVEAEAAPGILYALLHQFVVPLLSPRAGTSEAMHRRATHTLELLLHEALAGTDRFAGTAGRGPGQVVASAIKELYARGAKLPILWARVSVVAREVWLGSDAYLHLLPLAVAESAPQAAAALEEICAQPATYPHHCSILKGALPSFARTPALFGKVLKLARATADPQLLYAFFDKALGAGEWATLVPTVIEQNASIEQVARIGIASGSPQMRISGYLLLAMMVRHEVVAPPAHSEAMNWFSKERQSEIRSAVIPLLETATSAENVEATTHVLLQSATAMKASSFNQTVDSLRAVLAIAGARLNASTRDDLLRFALREGAIEPQVSIVGRLVDICCASDELQAANEVALAMLTSKTARQLSVTQRRGLGHHLDKPFLSLYRKLQPLDLQRHVEALRGMDPYLGRLIVTSICKSERTDLASFLMSIMSNGEVHPELKRIIQDYRQILWRR